MTRFPALLLISFFLFCCALTLPDETPAPIPPPAHFVPKPPVSEHVGLPPRYHVAPTHPGMACCSAGSCARDHHHMANMNSAFDWHEEIVPLENAPDDQGWHVIKDSSGAWPQQIVRT